MSTASSLSYIVTSAIILTLCTFLYLLVVNIISRRAVRTTVTSRVFLALGPCLSYLCLLHVTSWITLFGILLKQTKLLYTSYSCEVVNKIIIVSWILCRFFIGLIWESRHRAMTDVLDLENSYAGKIILLFAKVLVLAPLVLLPLAICSSTSHWEEDDKICVTITQSTVTSIELYTILGVSLIFFVLFLIKVWQASHMVSIFRSDVCQLYKGSQVSDFEKASKCVHQRARRTTVRNVLVIFLSLFWLVFYDAPLNRSEEPGTTGFSIFINGSRLVAILDLLTTNIVLYLVFRNWSLFLCYPCRSSRSAPLLNECFSEDLQLPLLDDESRPTTTKSSVQCQSTVSSVTVTEILDAKCST